jgi:hypothetical protein
VARARLGLLDEAKEDLTAALKLEPTSKDVRRELKAVKEQLAQQVQKEKKTFSGFFNKVGGWSTRCLRARGVGGDAFSR